MTFHRHRAEVSIQVLDESGKPVAAKCAAAPIGAGDVFDAILNIERFAVHVTAEVNRQLHKLAAGGGIIVLDIQAALIREGIAKYLRDRAAELVGKTLYHPDRTLTAWADELFPAQTSESQKESTGA